MLDDGPMKLIDAADRGDVQKAILLLRLARALNLGRSRAVQKVRVGVRSPEVKLTLVPRRRMGVDLELWAIEKDCSYFREVFGRELSTAVS
jgi:exopolyphosphatase/guanosine-5'-triphosphate,3'-diphosphate pyrophosphatase